MFVYFIHDEKINYNVCLIKTRKDLKFIFTDT